MAKFERTLLIQALSLVLMPVARLCLRNSLKIQDLMGCAKTCFLRAAEEELKRQGEKVTPSRLSIMSGMQRKDIARCTAGHSEPSSGKALITKVVGQWQTDKRFLTGKGTPRALTIGQESEFARLVAAVSCDVNPATVLFELERTGSIIRTGESIKLCAETYLPLDDAMAGFNILSMDSDDIISAVEENILTSPRLPHLHLRTEYDRIRADRTEEIKTWLLKEGNAFHTRARNFISKFDEDVNPNPKYRGEFSKVVLGSFSRVRGAKS